MNKKVLIIVAVVIVAAAIIGIGKARHASAPSEHPSSDTSLTDEQNNTNEDTKPVEPDFNTQEFKITTSNVSCSSSTVNGQTVQNCSGNIRVIPRGQEDIEPGLYKINEQTKLLHNGVAQDLNSLQQLSQNQTPVKLKFADGSNDTLSEITY